MSIWISLANHYLETTELILTKYDMTMYFGLKIYAREIIFKNMFKSNPFFGKGKPTVVLFFTK